MDATNARRVVGEAMRLSRESGKEASDVLAAFFARAICLQEPASFPMQDGYMDLKATEELARRCVTQMNLEDNPKLDTIKMQLAMDLALKEEVEMAEASETEREDNARTLENNIVNARVIEGDAKAEMDMVQKIYGQVYTFVCIRTAMDDCLKDEQAEKECYAALESVFPQHGARRFLTFTKDEKRAQLQELAHVVLGVRLFNRHGGKGGADLPAPETEYGELASALEGTLTSEAKAVREQIWHYLMVLNHKGQTAKPRDPELVRLRDEMVNRVQYLVYIDSIMEHADVGNAAVGEMLKQRKEALDELLAAVGGKASVTKDKVYPLFEALGRLHMALLAEVLTLEVKAKVAQLLPLYRNTFAPAMGLHDVHAARSVFVDSQAEGGADGQGGGKSVMETAKDWTVLVLMDDVPGGGAPPTEAAIQAGGTKLVRVDAGDGTETSREGHEREMAEFLAIEPDLYGFCPVSIVRRNGLAIAGDRSLGYVLCKGKHYAFAAPAFMDAFRAAPDVYLQELQVAAMRHPDLVRLLNMGSQFPGLAVKELTALLEAAPVKCDFGAQTPTHFVEKHIDYNYEWNEWALRRRALQLADLRNKRTHSMQTNLSHFRRDNESQVWLPKESATQSAVNKGSTMPKKLRVVQGLRGAPTQKMNVVTLDLDIGQPHAKKKSAGN
eukprot:jgi/Mesvir1/20497/Mv12383-RA.1